MAVKNNRNIILFEPKYISLKVYCPNGKFVGL